ncbi:hypothetical protein F4802DRAFT_612367 [Xylaria palmicola]|nr:hypothetical protein F4802DRAFT_612367 [Xylaria palmicola]
MSNYDTNFGSIVKPNDIFVSEFNFGCGSSREQAATAIPANQILLVVTGSFRSISSRNSINNELLGLELRRLIERLRATFPPVGEGADPADGDVVRNIVEVQEGENEYH